ncbi:chondroitin AC/alginate lyase [Auriculariales sp. MPI-PUGE-AT-0066]|nr:chondroitin AC/alginate lyase [Auriculariales sp. MPI-PUGE-AT-0066]
MLVSSLSSTFVVLLAFTSSAFARPSTQRRACPPKPTDPSTPDDPPTQDPPTNANIPNTVVIDGTHIATVKADIEDGKASQAVQDSLKALLKDADGWVGQGPWSVMDKPDAAPNATNKHDYYSMAPYFWPSKKTKSNPDGCPYIQKDGQRNPEVDDATDRQALSKMAKSIPSLSMAWYYTGKSEYAEQAAKNVRAWYIDEATRMTPNLQHAQAIKCKNSGRYIGIIDFSQHFTTVLDAVKVLESGPAPGWTKEHSDGFKQWASDFYDWLSDSQFGKDETKTTNNHGTFADMQRAGLALFLGKTDEAKDIVNGAKSNRVDKQITGDGKLPQELERTRPFHYSCFTLMAYVRMAQIADKLDVDLWGYTGPDGQSILKAVSYIIPYATGEKEWNHQDLKFQRLAALDVIHAAAESGYAPAKDAVKSGKLDVPDQGDLFPVRPAAEQLDSIAG